MSTQQFERFGKYLLLEKLATGGMAEVFLGRSSGASGIAKFFAIKRILPQYAESPEFIEMFKDEAKIAINLNHSNIVSIHEFGVQNNQFFLVMDYVEGRNLRQILNKMKKSSLQFSLDQVVFMIKEIAGGLDHAHRCLDANTGKPLNITHRDMSPQNIMVSFEGEVKIVDFGIAKAESQMENTRAGTLKGKFGYMSPEQAEGQPIDLRTDIFSLGIVLWELLANDRLFSANNELNTLRKIRDCQIPSLRKINPNIHAELERIAQKALARDRNLRYQTAAAFHRDLNRFLNRQYPDFSHQDFSVFTKSIFADEIMNTRKRLVEYSKLSLGAQNNQEEHTVVYETKTDSLVVTDSSSNMPKNATVSDIVPSGANLLLDDTVGNKSILDQDSIRRETSRKISISPSLEEHDPLFRTASGRDRARYTQPRIHLASEPSVRGTTIALFFAVVLGIYSYLVKYHTNTMVPIMKMTNPILSPLHDALGANGTTDASSTLKPAPPMITPAPVSIQTPTPTPPVQATQPAAQAEEKGVGYIVISSKPSGAEIFVNKQNTGMITPSRVKIPADKPFDLVLKRPGYAEFHRANATVQQLGTHMQASLDENHVGYLEIDVIPIRKVKLSINGQRVYDNPPYKRVAVPAGIPIHVRIDDGLGSWDETVTEIARNQRKHIKLSLRRKPSNN